MWSSNAATMGIPKVVIIFIGSLLVVEGSCPAPAPCSCLNGYINCEARRLQVIPRLRQVIDLFHTLAMGTNEIVAIHNNTFINLNVTSLYLEYNKIGYIDVDAFRGLNYLKVLRLQHNKLQVLPEALKPLPRLQDLDVSYNLIDGETTIEGETVDGFADDVMKDLGQKLISFKFGDPLTLMHWPQSVHHLQKLKILHISGALIQYLPALPFRAFEHTLEELRIEKTQLMQLPLEIGKLSQIKELHINHNRVVAGDDMVLETVFADIGDTLEILSLEYDNLNKFPDPIKYLIHLTNLSLAGNPLKYVRDEAIHSIGNGKLVSLRLSDCGLHRVPGALSNLTSLLDLDLSSNNIRTIESHDLVTLPNLLSVSFRENPLKHVSSGSFNGLLSLQKLDFSYTQVSVIPVAIQNLTGLREVDLNHTPLDCTCDLVWVRRWIEKRDRGIKINGRCETIDSWLQPYIMDRLPKCPQYSDSPMGVLL